MAIKTCKVCGKEFEASRNQYCCSPECSEINRRQMWNQIRMERRAEQKRRLKGSSGKVKKITLCDQEYCMGCVYYRFLNHQRSTDDTSVVNRVCHYCYYTGKKRPCPAGKGCTEKTTDNSAILEFKRRNRRF